MLREYIDANCIKDMDYVPKPVVGGRYKEIDLASLNLLDEFAKGY